MMSTVEPRRSRYRRNDESLGASTPGELSVRRYTRWQGEQSGHDLALVLRLAHRNMIGDEEGLTFDPVNFWAGWLLLALALDLAGAHAKRASKAGR